MKIQTIAHLHPGDSLAPLSLAPVRVPAGWPSPAQDYITDQISLDDMLIRDQAATFLVEVTGHSMEQAGISDGDVLVVEKGREAKDGDVVVAHIDGEMTVKRLRATRGGVVLHAESRDYPDITVPEMAELSIWGVVRYCLHKVSS